MAANSAYLAQHRIRLQESTQRRMIMAALQIIQTYGVIIHIVTVAEGVVFAQIVFSITLDRDNLAPSIVFISYDLRVMTRQNANDVALKIVLVEETRVIQLNMRRLAIGIVVEVNLIGFRIRFTAHLRITRDVNQFIAIPEAGEEFHMILAVVFIVDGMYTFVQPAKGIIAKGYFFVSCSTRSTLRGLSQQIIIAVRIRPAIYALDIGTGISDGCALVGNQLIAPVGSTVGNNKFDVLFINPARSGVSIETPLS